MGFRTVDLRLKRPLLALKMYKERNIMTFDKFAKYTKYAKTQRDVTRTLLTPWILCYITFGSIKALIEPFLGPFQSASHPPFPHLPHLARRAAARPAQPSHTRRTQPLQREARPRRHHELAVHAMRSEHMASLDKD